MPPLPAPGHRRFCLPPLGLRRLEFIFGLAQLSRGNSKIGDRLGEGVFGLAASLGLHPQSEAQPFDFLIPLSTLNQKIKRLGIDVRRRGRGNEMLSASMGK